MSTYFNPNIMKPPTMSTILSAKAKTMSRNDVGDLRRSFHRVVLTNVLPTNPNSTMMMFTTPTTTNSYNSQSYELVDAVVGSEL